MNSLALAIMSFPGASDVVHRHFPYYEKAGAQEIIGIGTTDGATWWPKGVREERIGANLYIVGNHLPLRLLRTFVMLLATKHDWFCVIEYDCIFLLPVPRDLPLGLTTHLGGGKPAGYRCSSFYHCPWICDRETAEKIVEIGYQIIHEGISDPSPDCHIGQIVERVEIPVHTDILKSYSRNTIHDPWVEEARQARLNGAVAIHGVKSADVLERITL